MTKVTLNGINRKVIIQSNDNDVLFRKFIKWLEEYPHYTKRNGNVFTFANDNHVFMSAKKARREGLKVDY